MAASLAPTPPASFTATALLEGRSDVLYAKIRRGGMGTGMPNFGALFTPEETWALVDYLWLLALGETSPEKLIIVYMLRGQRCRTIGQYVYDK